METFQLLYTPGLPDPANEYSTTLGQIVSPPPGGRAIRFAFLENFKFDLAWLMEACPAMLLTEEGGVIVHGDGAEAVAANTPHVPHNFSFSKPELLPYGTHHSKVIMLFFDNAVRVAILTGAFSCIVSAIPADCRSADAGGGVVPVCVAVATLCFHSRFPKWRCQLWLLRAVAPPAVFVGAATGSKHDPF